MTLAIALAIPFALFYTDTSFKDSDDIRAEFADVDAIAISRVPEVDAPLPQWQGETRRSLRSHCLQMERGAISTEPAAAVHCATASQPTMAEPDRDPQWIMEIWSRLRAAPQGLHSDTRRRLWWRLGKRWSAPRLMSSSCSLSS